MAIHLIAAGKLENPNNWPELWHHCYNIWKSSPYEIKLWGDANIDQLLEEDDKEFFKILNTLPPIYKWDYIRYVILERFGGAYFDMDVEIIHDFLPLLDKNKHYFMEGTGGTLVENSILVSKQLNPDSTFWNRFKMYSKRKILENLKECHIPYNVLHYVGPWMMTEVLIKSFLNQKDKMYSVLGYEQFANPNNNIVFSKHYTMSTWNKK